VSARRAIALLGEPLLLDLAAGGIVLRHDADPRRQVPAVLEQLSIGDASPEPAGDVDGCANPRKSGAAKTFGLRLAVFLVATLGGTTRQILFPFPLPYGIEGKRKRKTPQFLFLKRRQRNLHVRETCTEVEISPPGGHLVRELVTSA
jgi:hypothetical protein